MKLLCDPCASRRRGGRRPRRRARGSDRVLAWPRCVFGPLWLLARGLWLALLGLCRRSPPRSSRSRASGVLRPGAAVGAVRARPSLSRASRAARWRSRRASARGRPLVDVVFAGSALEAEKIYLERALAAGAAAAAPRRAAGAARRDRPVPGAGPMKVAIVDYGSGNLHSAHKAFERAAREAGLARGGARSPPIPTGRARRRPRRAARRRRLRRLPARARRRRRHGRGARRRACAGAAGRSSASASACNCWPRAGWSMRSVAGLDWIPGDVAVDPARRPRAENPAYGLEHARRAPPASRCSTGVDGAGLHAYFVHSYQLYPAEPDDVVATADYGGPITAIVARDNVAGTQFHPEKSQTLGLALIANFLKWRP